MESKRSLRVLVAAALASVPAVAAQGAPPLLEDHTLFQDDCGTGRDPQWGSAATVEPPVDCTGRLQSGDEDPYILHTTRGLLYSFEAAAPDDLGMTVQDPSTGFPNTVFEVVGPEIQGWRHLGDSVRAVVLRNFGGSGSMEYGLRIDSSPFADTPDCGGPGDADDGVTLSTTGSRLLPHEGACDAVLDVGDVRDDLLVQSDGTTAFTVVVSTESGAGALHVGLMAEDAEIVRAGRLDTGPDSVALEVEDPGVARGFHVWVERPDTLLDPASTAIAYRVEVERRPLTPADDCGTGSDLPWAVPSPASTTATACSGGLAPFEPGDIVRIPAPGAPAMMVVTYTGPPKSAVEVITPAREAIVHSGGSRGVLDGTESELLLAVSNWGEGGPYTWSYAFVEDPQDDCGAGHDAPRGFQNGLPLSGAVVCTGTLDWRPDSQDSYVVTAGAGDLVRFTADSTVVFDLSLASLGAGSPGSGVRLFRTVTHAEVWLQVSGPTAFRLDALSAPASAYTIALDHRAVTSYDDCGSGHEAAESHGLAVVMPGPGTCSGVFDFPSDWDGHRIDVAAGSTFVIRVRQHGDPGELPLLQYLRPSGGVAPGGLPMQGPGPGEVLFTPFTVTEGGTWTVRVGTRGALYAYDLVVDVLPST